LVLPQNRQIKMAEAFKMSAKRLVPFGFAALVIIAAAVMQGGVAAAPTPVQP